MRKKKIIEQRDEARKLAEELIPYVKDYIMFGLELGQMRPEEHNEDNCFDCDWNRRAIAWDDRFQSGEIDRILGKGDSDG